MTTLPARFEVRTDRAALYRRVKRSLQLELLLVLLLAGVLGGCLAGAVGTLEDALALQLAVGVGIGIGAAIGTLVWMLTGPVTWLLRREMPVPMVADAAGIWMAVPGTAAGSVRLPWQAVKSLTARGRGTGVAVVVRMRRDVRPDAPGVEGLGDSVTVTAARRGIVVSTVGTDTTARDALAVLEAYRRAAQGAPVG